MDFFAFIGIAVCVLAALAFLGFLFESVPTWFPAWRAKRASARFEKGAAWARRTVLGENDKDIRSRYREDMHIDAAVRLRYCMSLVDESRYFAGGKRDSFDEGVLSVISTPYFELGLDEGDGY